VWNRTGDYAAAAGYFAVGMNRESLAELNAIEKRAQDRPEVL
jgi:hypothetical protein